MPPPDDPRDDDDLPRARRSRRDPDDRDDRDRYEDEEDDRRGGRHRHYDEDGYEITSNDQMWAIFSHIGVFIISFVAPLVIYFAFADKSKFVKRHARESLNHQISLMLYIFGWLFVAALVGLAVGGVSQSAAAGFITGYVLFLLGVIALSVVNMILLILATLAASRYEHYRYPMSIRLLG
jgi:uncharacterized protein